MKGMTTIAASLALATACLGSSITGTGQEVTMYFLSTEAAYDSRVLANGLPYFPNHTSVPGQMVSLGTILDGAGITLQLDVITTGDLWSVEDPDHARLSEWTANDLISVSGIRVSWEDLPATTSDWDYNDHEVVIHGARYDPVPEPATMFLMAVGLIGIGTLRKVFV